MKKYNITSSIKDNYVNQWKPYKDKKIKFEKTKYQNKDSIERRQRIRQKNSYIAENFDVTYKKEY